MIEVNHITKSFNGIEILKDISFKLSNSEILVLSGPSGCGKTTLLRTIAGFEKPDAGKIIIDKIEASSPNKMIAPSLRKLSMIFQDLALWPHMSVEKHISFTLKKQKLPKDMMKPTINEILSDLKLDQYTKRYPHQLSGGEKQRLAIARALASKAKYLLMDEPFSNLDNVLKKKLHALVIQLKTDYHMGIIYVTHNVKEIMDMSDRVAIMHEGSIVQLDEPEQLIRNPENDFVSRLIQ